MNMKMIQMEKGKGEWHPPEHCRACYSTLYKLEVFFA